MSISCPCGGITWNNSDEKTLRDGTRCAKCGRRFQRWSDGRSEWIVDPAVQAAENAKWWSEHAVDCIHRIDLAVIRAGNVSKMKKRIKVLEQQVRDLRAEVADKKRSHRKKEVPS